jgi:hypothetical protein
LPENSGTEIFDPVELVMLSTSTNRNGVSALRSPSNVGNITTGTIKKEIQEERKKAIEVLEN